MAIKLALLVVFFGIMLAVGIHCRRHATDVNGFVLGGRSVGAWLTAFAYGTSYFSAVIFVGYAGQFGWRFGVASTWIGLGNAFLGSLLAWVVLGRRTRLMSQHLDSATMPEFFGKRFGSRGLKIGASIIVFIFLIPYTASLYNGLSRLFGMAFDIDYAVCVIVMAVLTGVYVIAGGYMATAINDFIQGIIMIVGIIAVIAAVLHSHGGFMAALEGLAKLVKDSGAELVGAGIVIEKAFQPGGDRLRAEGLRIESLARIKSMSEETGVEFVDGTRPGNQAVVDIAKSQVGNVGGQPYWSWYGFNSRVEWCACFVSWCYGQMGLSEPRFAACQAQGIPWFQSHGQWGARGYADIAPGDAIFFDWDLDGSADHVGIVVGTDGSRVYTVEGNSGDACKIKSYDLNYECIKGYGLMNW